MREARVQARAIPELQAALAAHQITLYRGGELAKLPPDQQEIAVAQWTARTRLRVEGQAVAAQVIRLLTHHIHKPRWNNHLRITC